MILVLKMIVVHIMVIVPSKLLTVMITVSVLMISALKESVSTMMSLAMITIFAPTMIVLLLLAVSTPPEIVMTITLVPKMNVTLL